MESRFYNRDLVSIKDLSKEEILQILEVASQFKSEPPGELLKGKIMGSCFFEPSTRTRLSFEAAMLRLGGQVIGFSEGSTTSAQKGESLADSMRMLDAYADVVVLRHPLEGAAQHASELISTPVINAGDGSNQHPTQTLLDLFTIKECQGRLDNLRIALAGDLKFARSIHSLAEALAHFHPRLYLISPDGLELPKELCESLRKHRIIFSFHHSFEEVMPHLDVLYMTRIQKERFSDPAQFEKVNNSLILRPEHLETAKDSLRILHPLPRVREIDSDIDATPYAYYFQQAQNGLYIRKALLALLFNKVCEPVTL